MEEKARPFNINEFKERTGGSLARPTLFDIKIQGYERSSHLVCTANVWNSDLLSIAIYENEEGETEKFLSALKAEGKPFEVVFTRYRRDGTSYLTTTYVVTDFDYSVDYSWDATDKLVRFDVYFNEITAKG